MNNIIIIGAILFVAAIVITVLSVKLHRKKKEPAKVETKTQKKTKKAEKPAKPVKTTKVKKNTKKTKKEAK